MSSTTTGLARPDTDDMKVVHRVFREVFAQGSALVETVATGDVERAEVVSSYFANVCELLHVHHEGEDELVWPVLAARSGPAAELVQTIAAQHGDVSASLQRTWALLETWAATADPGLGTALVASLDELRSIVVSHLDQEEEHVLPLAAEHLTVEEWGALPGHAMANFSGDKLWLCIGLIRDRMTQEQRDVMLAHMPPPAVDFWQRRGEPSYRAFMANLEERG